MDGAHGIGYRASATLAAPSTAVRVQPIVVAWLCGSRWYRATAKAMISSPEARSAARNKPLAGWLGTSTLLTNELSGFSREPTHPAARNAS